jgi:hypothetical protein
MPLIDIRRYPDAIDSDTLSALTQHLPARAAATLSCEEGGILAPEAIMIEVHDSRRFDRNTKDIRINVWAHDYPSRRKNLDDIRKRIAEEVLRHLPEGVSWSVWVLLAPTSYGSDTEQ